MNAKKRGCKSNIFFTFAFGFMLCFFMATSSWAARKIDLSPSDVNYIKQLNEKGIKGEALGLTKDEDIKLVRSREDFNGITHSRYRQFYKGIPVWGMETIISKDHKDKVVALHGDLLLDTPRDIDKIPDKLDPLGALKKMKDEHKAKDPAATWEFRNESYGTYIYFTKKNKAELCCVVSFFADTDCGTPSRPIFFIDAKNGKVIETFDSLAYGQGTGPGGNCNTGQYTYNDSGGTYPGFGVTVNGSTCTMNTTNVKTVDLNHGTSGTTAFSYTCYENTHEYINCGYCPMNDAQYFGQVIYDMYQAWYGVPVLPFQLMMRCHYSNNYENAFWDGSSMTFGDGYTTFFPLVALDVSAHEVSHGFTENHSNLTYAGQSGGINEAFSDMAGEAAEYYMKGTNDFKVGYEIFKSPTGALRYMYDPPLDGQSIDHVSDYYDGLDVQYSSGIYNKVFYLIATSSGWNTRKAFDIFTRANVYYWTASETFASGATDVVTATGDYGYNCTDVLNAFAVVGITVTCPTYQPPVAAFVGTPLTGGSPLTVNFTDQSTNCPTSWSWNFGDSGTSTSRNPSHAYTSAGTYTVTLTATNQYGSDNEVKTDYITVLPPQVPVANFSASSTSIIVGDTVTFTDQSTNTPTSWSWAIEGGTPGTSTSQNPTITYNNIGTYDVTLVATNAYGSDSETKANYITVNPGPWDEIAEAVDYTSTFTKSGNANWFGVTNVYYYDYDSARSGTITHSQSTTIQTTVTVGSTQAVKFYWKVSSESGYDYLRFYIDGVQKNQISGTVDWTQVSNNIASGTHTLKWTYSKDPSVSSGSDCGWVDKLVIVDPVSDPIAEAVDYAGLTFTLTGNANWFSETTTTYYGGDAAQSGAITHSQSSSMETTISGKTTVKFYWKVSSEASYDYLRFYIDGVLKNSISGSTGWAQKSYTVTSGTHTLKWSYIKDDSVSSGSDCGWVDKLELQ